MKKYLFIILALTFAGSIQAEEVATTTLTCKEGQEVKSVLVSEAVVGTPAVTHTVTHEAVTHEVPAYTTYENVGYHNGDYIKIGSKYFYLGKHLGSYDKVDHPAETVVDTPAWDEVIIDTPEVVATPAVYEDQCVDKPAPVVKASETPKTTHKHGQSMMTACNYIRVFMPNCVDTKELNAKFQTDQNFRNAVIYYWRMTVFGR